MTRPHERQSGLKIAMRDYRRLCADPLSGPYNVTSAVAIIREGLESSRLNRDILRALAQASQPLSTQDLNAWLRRDELDTTVATYLLMLLDYTLVERQWTVRERLGGGYWKYWLSPLGKAVMEVPNA
jgi:hypothetical protein